MFKDICRSDAYGCVSYAAGVCRGLIMPSRTLLGALYILLRVSNLFVLTRRLPTAEVVERAAGDTLVLSVCGSDIKHFI